MASRTRKRSSALTAAEQQRYVTVLTALIKNGKYGQLVEIHNQNHHQHSSMPGMPGMGGGTGRKRFLSWHRASQPAHPATNHCHTRGQDLCGIHQALGIGTSRGSPRMGGRPDGRHSGVAGGPDLLDEPRPM